MTRTRRKLLRNQASRKARYVTDSENTSDRVNRQLDALIYRHYKMELG